MKFLLISPKNRSVYNFRGELIKRIKEHGFEVSVTGPDRSDMERVDALGVSFNEIPLEKNGTSIVGDIRYCSKLYRLIKKIKPDVILGYTVKPVIYGTIAGWLGGVKNINCLIAGGGYTFTASTTKAKVLGVIVRILYRIAFQHSTHVIFQNEDDKNEFVQRKLVKECKCRVVNGSGVDMSHYTPTEYPDKVSFFMLSRLLKCKGVEEYLKAAEIVKNKYPETKLYILGKHDGGMQDSIDLNYIKKLVSQGTVEWFDETTEVRPYYEMCSVYVLPSYREGTPRTVLEAMAMGRPIITTDTNGCRGTVSDGKTGFLVPIKNADAVAEKMIWFIEHPDAIEPMGHAATEYCREKFDINRVNKNMLKFMEIEG